MGNQVQIYQHGAGDTRRYRVIPALALAIFSAGSLLQAQSAGAGDRGQNAPSSELVSHESQPTFKLQVERNLVLVRVVVRNSKGRAVGNLRKEDFHLLDNGKPQSISHFVQEVPPSRTARPAAPKPQEQDVEPDAVPESVLSANAPQRYMAMFFDDAHMEFGDVVRTRDAADRYLARTLQASDRVAIFTSSGRTMLDFTDDRNKLHEALLRLQPRQVVPQTAEGTCPEISDYQAYMIVHRRDPQAIYAATEETYACFYEGTNLSSQEGHARAQTQAEAEAMRVQNLAEMQSEYSFRGVEQVVRRMGSLPGQRQVVLVSPGFFTAAQEQRITEISDHALRANVVISTLNAQGLSAPLPLGDASKRPIVVPRRADVTGKKAMIILDGFARNMDVLRYLASDTGGFFFNNSNDLDQGFERAGAFPEVSYVLGFSPQNLKSDGRFHTLTVKLANPAGLSVQARRGYFAPKKALDASAQAQEEIEQALFSQDELSEIPVDVHTQFFKLNESDARISVLMHLDLRFLRFRKDAGRNLNHLTVVTALFDRDGKYLTAKEKLLDFRLRDESLDHLIQSGLTMKTSFDVKPGTYLLRQVVRDTEGGQLSGLNRTVEVPF